MEKRNKTRDKQYILLNALKKSDGLFVSDVMELLGCNRQSAYNYLTRLGENGYPTERKTVNGKAFYTLGETEEHLMQAIPYKPLNFDDLRKYSILCALSDKTSRFTHLRDKFDFDVEIGLSEWAMQGSETVFHRLCRELVKEGEITLDEKRYYLTGKSLPIVLNFGDDELWNVYNELSGVSKGHPYYEQLHNVYIKMAAYLGLLDEVDSNEECNNYIIYGRTYQRLDDIGKRMNELERYDYKGKVLSLEYRSARNKVQNIRFAVGMVVYSLEKDALYLLGEGKNKGYLVIKADGIQSIEETDEKNTQFQSNFYRSAFDEMFGISFDKPERVKVEFKCVADVRRKVYYLAEQRKKTASIEEIEEIEKIEGIKEIEGIEKIEEVEQTNQINNKTIIYTDTVRGLSDFASYIRQFGKAAWVIEPPKLKKIMEISVKNTLKRYVDSAVIKEEV